MDNDFLTILASSGIVFLLDRLDRSLVIKEDLMSAIFLTVSTACFDSNTDWTFRLRCKRLLHRIF